MSIGCLSILVHGKARITEGIAGREFFRVFCIALVQWDHGVSLVDIFYQIINCFHVVALVTQEGTLLKGESLVGGSKYVLNNGRIRHIGGRSQFIKGQTGNAVHQHMVFVSPVKLITPFIVLVGRGMNTQRTVWVGFWVVFGLELVFGKGLLEAWCKILCKRNSTKSRRDAMENA